jgi:endonuclease YncB( thermonuclease family)
LDVVGRRPSESVLLRYVRLPVRCPGVIGVVVVVLAAVMSACVSSAARAQVPVSATVTRVVDGDTLAARLADGREVTVRLIGIDAPAAEECGYEQAREALRRLVEGQPVNLLSDPTQAAVDRFGRSLFYVDRGSDGLDTGEEMVRRGWAEVFVSGSDFQRLPRYEFAAVEASHGEAGVWARCKGDFHRSRADELRDRRLSAAHFMRRYYSSISRRRFLTAWRMLGTGLRRKFGPYRQWRAGYRRSLGTSVLSARVRLSGGRAVVTVSLRARDRDACSGRAVRQYFRGRWLLAPRRDSWVAVRVRLRKTGGGRVRLSTSDCRPQRPSAPPPPPPPQRPPRNCQGYDPCLPPGADVDCADGSGNGPRYVEGPVDVRGDDPYGLDNDGDGVGCES